MPYYDTQGCDYIIRERFRQLELGFDSAHDDTVHDALDALLAAAECYIGAALVAEGGGAAAEMKPPARWPWLETEWNPSSDPVRNLSKAGALVAAEIDRVLRKQREVDGRAAELVDRAVSGEGD